MKKYIFIGIVASTCSTATCSTAIGFAPRVFDVRLEADAILLGLDLNNLAAGAPDSLGQLLYYAAEDYPDLVGACIAAGADPNWRDEEGDFPLLIAAGMGHFNAVESLLNANAEINHVNDTGESALHRAVMHKHFVLACFLLERGALPFLIDQANNRPFNYFEAGDEGVEGYDRLLPLLVV